MACCGWYCSLPTFESCSFNTANWLDFVYWSFITNSGKPRNRPAQSAAKKWYSRRRYATAGGQCILVPRSLDKQQFDPTALISQRVFGPTTIEKIVGQTQIGIADDWFQFPGLPMQFHKFASWLKGYLFPLAIDPTISRIKVLASTGLSLLEQYANSIPCWLKPVLEPAHAD